MEMMSQERGMDYETGNFKIAGRTTISEGD